MKEQIEAGGQERPEQLPAQIDPTKLRYLVRRKLDESYWVLGGIHYFRQEVFLVDPRWEPAMGGKPESWTGRFEEVEVCGIELAEGVEEPLPPATGPVIIPGRPA